MDFRILHPGRLTSGKDNNQSCVLRIVSDETSFLLPGDIERGPEIALVHRYGEELRADVLIAPHHGSDTSSSASFLDAVAPQATLFSVGYRNRFGFPAGAVLARCRERGVRTLNTALHGAIRVSVDNAHEPVSIYRHRTETARFWNWRAED